jgi:hypothetical protein
MMQVGAENRTKLIAAVALMVVALLLVGRWLFSSGGTPSVGATAETPSAAAPQDEPKPAAPTRHVGRNSRQKATRTTSRSLDPTLRYDWLRASEDTQYKGTGRNIFQAQIDIPKPIFRPNTDKPKPAPPPGPPPPPPIELKFFGFASRPGEPKSVFLAHGEDVFIAHEGQIIDRRYKVLRISPVSVEVEDVINNNRQEIPLTQG